MTDEEWQSYLDKFADLSQKDFQTTVAAFEEKLQPLQELVESQQLRDQMARRVKKSRVNTATAPMKLLSGDRVLARSSQYRSKIGHGKFEVHGDGRLKEFIVQSITGSIATLKEQGSGSVVQKHESLLKVLPLAVEGDQTETTPWSPNAKMQLQALPTIDSWYVKEARGDGACLFRSLSMGLEALAGVAAHHVEDNEQRAFALRKRLVRYSELHLQGLWLMHSSCSTRRCRIVLKIRCGICKKHLLGNAITSTCCYRKSMGITT